MSTQNKGWPKIATIRRSDKPQNANDKNLYVKLADGVEIFVDGKKVPLNKSRTLMMEDPRHKVSTMVKNGKLTEEKAKERLDSLNSMEWLRYELVANPPQD